MRRLLPSFLLAFFFVPMAGAAAEVRESASPASFFRHGVALRSAPNVESGKKKPPARRSVAVVPSPRPWTPAPTTAVRDFRLQPAGYTPYDRYMGPVRAVFAGLTPRRPSAAEACRLLRISKAFRYAVRDPYRADPPAVTAARGAGDCKAKALWLYDQLGDPTALYVIGKLNPRAKASHAWLYWRWEGRWWILDPTNLANPIAADSVGRGRYVPYYSFSREAAYRHPATHLLVAGRGGTTAEVAARR